MYHHQFITNSRPDTVRLAHKIELVPNQSQVEYFAKACGVSRFAYNWALANWKSQYKNWKEAEKKYEQAKENIKLTDVSTEDEQRIDKKLKKIQKKTNKKWWQFWK